jgi:hypothetical protein
MALGRRIRSYVRGEVGKAGLSRIVQIFHRQFKRAEINPKSEPELRAFKLALLNAQPPFIRFGETALDRYFRRLPAGALRA